MTTVFRARVRAATLATSCVIGCIDAAAGQEATVTRLDGVRMTGAEVDAAVERLVDAAHVTGLAVAIINDGQVVHLHGYGVRDREKHLPLTPTSVMYGASFTKAAFAYLVMQLAEEGRIDLDRPIEQMLPKPLPAYEKYQDLSADRRWKRFTPRMLLSHTSGMPNYRFLNDDEKLDIKFEPGMRYAYSGEGINLLQFVMEAGLGMDVGTLMQARVFDRFGMSRTSMTWRDDFSGDLALGHDESGASLGHRKRGGVRAAGSMDTTPADFARFLAAVTRGEGLSSASWAEMFRPQVHVFSVQQFPTTSSETTSDNRGIALAYGLGWGVFTSPFGPAVFKEGHDDGWNNYALVFPSSRTALLLMSNSSNGEGIFRALADELLGKTCLPWFWEGYIPFDQPQLKDPAALRQHHPPCEAR